MAREKSSILPAPFTTPRNFLKRYNDDDRHACFKGVRACMQATPQKARKQNKKQKKKTNTKKKASLATPTPDTARHQLTCRCVGRARSRPCSLVAQRSRSKTAPPAHRHRPQPRGTQRALAAQHATVCDRTTHSHWRTKKVKRIRKNGQPLLGLSRNNFFFRPCPDQCAIFLLVCDPRRRPIVGF